MHEKKLIAKEYQKLCLRLKTLSGRRGIRFNRIKKIKKRLNFLYQSLLPKYGRAALLKVPGAALFCLSLATTPLQVGAQSFAPAVDNAFEFTQEELDNELNIALADLDNDGDIDVFTTEAYVGHVFYKNVGTSETPEFADGQLNPFGLELNPNHGYGRVNFADMDNDGDLDLIVSEHDDLLYSENIGTPEAPQFGPQTTNPFGIMAETYLTISLADMDNDGDLDLLASGYDSFVYYENIGSVEEASFGEVQVAPFNLSDSNYGNVCTVDFDSDGDLDLITSETGFFPNIGAVSNFFYRENVGTPESPSFGEAVEDPFGLNFIEPILPYMSCADMDNDGDMDFLSLEYSFSEYSGTMRYYENLSMVSSVNVLPNDLTVQVFPTSTEDNIMIESNYSPTSIEVLDLTGRRLLVEKQATSNLSLNNLSSGAYFIKLNYEDGFVTKKVFKK
jgi:hypothetical protein